MGSAVRTGCCAARRRRNVESPCRARSIRPCMSILCPRGSHVSGRIRPSGVAGRACRPLCGTPRARRALEDSRCHLYRRKIKRVIKLFGLAHIRRNPLLLGEKQGSRNLVMLLVLHRRCDSVFLSKPASRGCTETRQGQKYVSLLASLVPHDDASPKLIRYK